MPFVEKGCVFTQCVDKIVICDMDFLVNLSVLFFRKRRVNGVVKGLELTRSGHCRIISVHIDF